MYQQPEPSWWSRNWKWVVPVGCLGGLVVFVGSILLFVFLVYGVVTTAIRSSDRVRGGMSRARAHPELKAALGEPIESGFWLGGNINVSGASGRADLSIPISGPKGSGTMYIVGTKSDNRWQYSIMEVEVAGRPSRVNLLARGVVWQDPLAGAGGKMGAGGAMAYLPCLTPTVLWPLARGAAVSPAA